MSIYKQASEIKLRFNTSKGVLSVEQLWDLSQAQLETVIKSVKKTLNTSTDTGLEFLEETSTVDPIEELRFNILKDVYITKKAAAETLRKAKDVKEHNEKIMSLIKQKEEEDLGKLSVDELRAQLIK